MIQGVSVENLGLGFRLIGNESRNVGNFQGFGFVLKRVMTPKYNAKNWIRSIMVNQY